jgi:hypothetical protein
MKQHYQFNISFEKFQLLNLIIPMRIVPASKQRLSVTQNNQEYLQNALRVKHEGVLTENEKGIAESINF